MNWISDTWLTQCALQDWSSLRERGEKKKHNHTSKFLEMMTFLIEYSPNFRPSSEYQRSDRIHTFPHFLTVALKCSFSATEAMTHFFHTSGLKLKVLPSFSEHLFQWIRPIFITFLTTLQISSHLPNFISTTSHLLGHSESPIFPHLGPLSSPHCHFRDLISFFLLK